MINIKILEDINDAKAFVKSQINNPGDTTRYQLYILENDIETADYLKENQYDYKALVVNSIEWGLATIETDLSWINNRQSTST